MRNSAGGGGDPDAKQGCRARVIVADYEPLSSAPRRSRRGAAAGRPDKQMRAEQKRARCAARAAHSSGLERGCPAGIRRGSLYAKKAVVKGRMRRGPIPILDTGCGQIEPGGGAHSVDLRSQTRKTAGSDAKDVVESHRRRPRLRLTGRLPSRSCNRPYTARRRQHGPPRLQPLGLRAEHVAGRCLDGTGAVAPSDRGLRGPYTRRHRSSV